MMSSRTAQPPRLFVELALGFVYWLVFVLILEPGNLMRWTPPDSAAWTREILRLAGAGLLGAAATPAIVAMSRRLPIEGPRVARRLATHVAFGLVAAIALIVASCLLSRLLPQAHRQPLIHDIWMELAANGPLVAAWIAGLGILAHAIRRTGPVTSRLTFRQRGRLTRLDVEDVSWIETQGNYIALHGAWGVRLVRGAAKALETKLDPGRFVRAHRRAIVAVEAVREVRPLAAGDAVLTLVDGTELRVSRTCRPGLLAALDAAAAARP
jgi:DNA-binding LytR/AlgR family response regulator